MWIWISKELGISMDVSARKPLTETKWLHLRGAALAKGRHGSLLAFTLLERTFE